MNTVMLTSDVDVDGARSGVADVVGGLTQVVAGVAGGDVAEVELAVDGGHKSGAAEPGVGAVGVADRPALEGHGAVLQRVQFLLVREQAHLVRTVCSTRRAAVKCTVLQQRNVQGMQQLNCTGRACSDETYI